MTEAQARALLREACEEAGSQRAFAREHGFSAAYISDVLLGRRAFGPAICDALKIKRNVLTEITFTKEK